MSTKVRFLLIMILFIWSSNAKNSNNACKTFSSYLNIKHSKNCYYISDVIQSVCDIAIRHTGRCETYKVTTEDGYILTTFRLPRQNPKGTILLQHSILNDCQIWLSQYNKSTALIFWNAGYDVWLGNSRGTTFGQEHVNLTVDSKKFWDFSFHEMGIYDHKATIDFILGKTNEPKLICIAHSMATTSFLIYASLRPQEAAAKVQVFVMMSPIAYFTHFKSPVKYLVPLAKPLKFFLNGLHVFSLADYNGFWVTLVRNFIMWFPPKLWFQELYTFLYGPTRLMDPNYLTDYLSHYPSAISWKIIWHYLQYIISHDKFAMYDYGHKKNLVLYKNPKPPLYPIESINTTLFLIHSVEDYFGVVKDVEFLYKNLPDQVKKFGKVLLTGLNHNDFLTGLNRQLVINLILKYLEKL